MRIVYNEVQRPLEAQSPAPPSQVKTPPKPLKNVANLKGTRRVTLVGDSPRIQRQAEAVLKEYEQVQAQFNKLDLNEKDREKFVLCEEEKVRSHLLACSPIANLASTVRQT